MVKNNKEIKKFESFEDLFSPPSIPSPQENKKRAKEVEKELKNIQEGNGYHISLNGSISIYTIYSENLKARFRDVMFSDEYWKSFGNLEGRKVEGDNYLYEEGRDGNPDTFEVVSSLGQVQGTNSSQIMEIDDEEAEKIHQENLEKERKQKEDEEKLMKKSDKLNISHEKNNNHKSGGNGSKYALPFIGGGLFFFIVGIVLAIKS